MLWNIKIKLHKTMMRKTKTTILRAEVQSAEVVWSHHTQKINRNKRKLERIQKTANKLVLELKESIYEERLKNMKLIMLEEHKEEIYLYLR